MPAIHYNSLVTCRCAAKLLEGTHDFTRFSSASTAGYVSPVKTLAKAEVLTAPYGLKIVFVGSGFLYNQCRHMVGCLISVGTSKLSIDHVQELLNADESHGESPRLMDLSSLNRTSLQVPSELLRKQVANCKRKTLQQKEVKHICKLRQPISLNVLFCLQVCSTGNGPWPVHVGFIWIMYNTQSMMTSPNCCTRRHLMMDMAGLISVKYQSRTEQRF